MEQVITDIQQAIIKHVNISRSKELGVNSEFEYDFNLFNLEPNGYIVISRIDCYKADRLFDKKFGYYFFNKEGIEIDKELDFDLTNFVQQNKKILNIIYWYSQ